MTLPTRTLHQACCPKCQGTGYYFWLTSPNTGQGQTVPCDHLTRVDVTGLDDETERWLAAERECDRLKDLFRRYGKHEPLCRYVRGEWRFGPCTCGFTAEWARVFGGGG